MLPLKSPSWWTVWASPTGLWFILGALTIAGGPSPTWVRSWAEAAALLFQAVLSLNPQCTWIIWLWKGSLHCCSLPSCETMVPEHKETQRGWMLLHVREILVWTFQVPQRRYWKPPLRTGRRQLFEWRSPCVWGAIQRKQVWSLYSPTWWPLTVAFWRRTHSNNLCLLMFCTSTHRALPWNRSVEVSSHNLVRNDCARWHDQVSREKVLRGTNKSCFLGTVLSYNTSRGEMTVSKHFNLEMGFILKF